MDVNADGSRIISGGHDHEIRIWNLKNGRAVGEPLIGYKSRVLCVALSMK